MYLYCSEEPFYMDELLKKIRKSGEVQFFSNWPDDMGTIAAEETMFGRPNIVVRLQKTPTGKEQKNLLKGDMEDSDNVFLLISPIARKDLDGELFSAMKDRKRFKFYPKCSLEQKEKVLIDELKVSPSIVSCVYDAIGQMDLTEFYTRLEQLRPFVPKITKEILLTVFPPIDKTNPFKLVELIENGEERRAISLIAKQISNGEEPLKILGIMRSAYSIAYKLSLAPSREVGVSTMNLPSFRANGIPKLTQHEALQKMNMCAECGEQLKTGRHPQDALFSLVGALLK